MSSNQNTNHHAPAQMQEDLEKLRYYFEVITDMTLKSMDDLIRYGYPHRQAPLANDMCVTVAMNLLELINKEKRRIFREEQNCGVSGEAMSTDNYDNNDRLFRHTIDGFHTVLISVQRRVGKYFQKNPTYTPPLGAMAGPVLKELKKLLQLADKLLYGYAKYGGKFTVSVYQTCITLLGLYRSAYSHVVNKEHSSLLDAEKVIPGTMFERIPKGEICFVGTTVSNALSQRGFINTLTKFN